VSEFPDRNLDALHARTACDQVPEDVRAMSAEETAWLRGQLDIDGEFNDADEDHVGWFSADIDGDTLRLRYDTDSEDQDQPGRTFSASYMLVPVTQMVGPKGWCGP
jgi:hypothetical protein